MNGPPVASPSLTVTSFTTHKTRPFQLTLGGCDDVNSYTKLNRIGEGTYDIVYSARHTLSGQIVALKRIRSEFTNEVLRAHPASYLEY